MIKDKLPTYSVLMSVYSRDNPQFLRLAIDSMLNQTVKTNDFVIVEDGEIGADLNSVIEEYSSKFDCFNFIKLTRNVGLGKALDAGIKYCKNNYVARMDADDISLLNRCEKQLKVFAKDPTLSIVGSWVDEFDIDPNIVNSTRCVPEDNEQIKKFLRHRSPFNHPVVMFKKDDVLRCGGYGPLKRKQDMDLFSRMINMGCIGYNIQESLLLFRANIDNLKRRKSKEYRKSTIEVAKLNYKRNYISLSNLIYIVVGQFVILLLPNFMLKRLLRKKKIQK